jgi:hypothetical protein
MKSQIMCILLLRLHVRSNINQHVTKLVIIVRPSESDTKFKWMPTNSSSNSGFPGDCYICVLAASSNRIDFLVVGAMSNGGVATKVRQARAEQRGVECVALLLLLRWCQSLVAKLPEVSSLSVHDGSCCLNGL